MNRALELVVAVFLMMGWIAGFVYSGSWWCIFPFYSWYVVIEHFITKYGI